MGFIAFLYWAGPPILTYIQKKFSLKQEITQIYEWASEDSYKIIILPFDEKGEDGSGDVGSLIVDRLIDKSKVDSLNIEVSYKDELTPSRTLADSATYYLYLDSADLIIYGRSMTGEWSGEGSQIWLNYQTDSTVDRSSESGYQAVTVSGNYNCRVFGK